MHQSTVTHRGQTTLPKAVRDALGVTPGDRVRYLITDTDVRIVKAQPVLRLAGLLRGQRAPVSLADMDAAVEMETVARMSVERDRR